MYRTLRLIRIAISTVFLLLLTLSIAIASLSDSAIAEAIREVQLIPAILSGAAVWLVIWVVLTITFGRIYCSSVCPFGTVQDISAAARRGACRVLRKNKPRHRYQSSIPALRVPIPIIVAACLCVGATTIVELTDPYSLYARAVNAIARPIAAGTGGLCAAALIIGIIIAMGWWRGRRFCNTVCPVGGLLGLISRNPIYRIDINTDLCIHCNRCVDVCKGECINPDDSTVDSSRCVMCMDCTAVCPNSAITLRRGRHTLSTPLMQSTEQ